MNRTHNWLKQIDNTIKNMHLLDHPFYQAWTRGELSLNALQDYAAQYYQHVDAFPRYLSALHSHTPDMETRRHILENLNDEEAGSPNHPELWLQFAQGLGVNRSDVRATSPLPETSALINSFLDICLNGTVAEGLAALYAYESQIPAVSRSKIDGLVKHYGISDEETYRYFIVHEITDIEHSAIERVLLTQHLSDSNVEAVNRAVARTLAGLYDLLDAICERHGISCAA